MLILYEIDIAEATSTRDSPTPLCEKDRLMQWMLIAHSLKGKNEPPKQLKLLIGLFNVILKEKNEPQNNYNIKFAYATWASML